MQLKTMRDVWAGVGLMALASVWSVCVAQTAAPAATAPRALGTVKAVSAGSMTVTTASGDATVTIPDAAKVLELPPGSKDLKAATPGVVSDIAVGDRVLVSGTAGDTATALTAQRIVLMKSAAIADAHAADEAAWKNGGGGIVKSVNATAGTVVISSGLKMVTVTTTPSTVVRRYSGDSVKFEDAVKSTVAAISPGDQLRVRGAKSADGSSIAADEIVTGSFKNFSGVIASIKPSETAGAGGSVTLKDLTTKKTVTVEVTANSDVRRLPAQAATMLAMRLKGGAARGAGGAGAPAAGGADDGQQRAGRAGSDLSSMLARLPTETLGGLKVGEAVMIVATSPAAQSSTATAVTLLAGVEPLLAASPAGESMTLTPWSVGGGAPDAGGSQ